MACLDSARLRRRMAELGMGVTHLAALTGLSRQTVHALLKPGFRPLVPSVDAVAATLGLDPATLVKPSSARGARFPSLARLLAAAAAGNPRAFELLPARLAAPDVGAVAILPARNRVHHQLAAAAAEVACLLSPSAALRTLVSLHSRQAAGNLAFFFSAGLMAPERIVEMTPEPMRKHLVFAAFSMDDFARHM